MTRLLLRAPLFRPLTRLGGFATRPLLPFAANFPSPFRTPLGSPQPIPSGSLNRNYFSSLPNDSSRPSSPTSTVSDKGLPENATISERLKYTIKKYGWYALGMYIFFSTLDFTFTFAVVNYLGADYATQLTESIKASLPDIFHSAPQADPNPAEPTGEGREGLYAMLILSYTIHKTLLLPFRVGLTAAFTPKFVKWLGRKGWAGTEGTKRAMNEARQKLRRNSNSSRGSSDS